MRTGLHGDAELEVIVHEMMVVLFRRRLHREQPQPLAIQHQLHLVGLVQALDVLIAVSRKPKLDLVLGVQREGTANHQSAACAGRKVLEVLLLCEVRRKVDGNAAGRTAGASNRQPADLLGRRQVSLQ